VSCKINPCKQAGNFLIIVIAAIVFVSCQKTDNNNSSGNKNRDTTGQKKKKSEDSLYKVIMVGDVMLGTNYPSEYSLPPDDGKTILDASSEYLVDADVTLGNLEGTLLNKGGTPKVCNNPENCVSFRMPEHYAGYLKLAGFDIMSVANNHSGDMGETGRKSTMETLEKYGITFAGYSTHPTAIFEKNGIKFGFTAFAPNTGTQSLLDHNSAVKTINELKKKCDIVIVSFHGGAEGSGATRVNRKREYYLEEDRGNAYEFAHEMIDAGADVVFGHGPHVPRGLEIYKDKIISYSLGNFCTYGKFGLSGNLGLAPILKVYIDKNGNFIKGQIFPFKQVKRGFPVYDSTGGAIELMRRMTIADFPDSGPVINNDGMITKK